MTADDRTREIVLRTAWSMALSGKPLSLAAIDRVAAKLTSNTMNNSEPTS